MILKNLNVDTVMHHCHSSLCSFLHLHVILLLPPPSDEALRLLRRTQSPSALSLAETHPLQGELEDATARAYATMGENNNVCDLCGEYTPAVELLQ